MTTKYFLRFVMLVSVLAPAPAGADWLVTPFAGGNFGGSTVHSQTNFGASAGWMGWGAAGIEFDAGWAPNFFDSGNESLSALISDSSVSTYMFNFIAGVPVGGQAGMGVRPYGSIGAGAIHTRVKSDLGLVDVKNTDAAWNVGGGVMGFMSNHVGLRGDLRYFKHFNNDLADAEAVVGDTSRFGFWRLTGGVVFRFGN
jgi:hypothetical protein